MSAKTGTIWAFHPDSGATVGTPVFDLGLATPSRLIAYLQQLRKLPTEDPGRPYEMFAEGKRLAPLVPFSTQGIVADAHVEISRKQVNMGG